MVAIVSGNSLGVSLTSLATLGQRGALGSASHGSTGENVYVNVSKGNLVVQDRDDRLVVAGQDVVALRTYNSQGLNDDDNQDDWTNGYMKSNGSLVFNKSVYPATATRTAADGAQAVYTWDESSSSYRSTAGSGAYDTISSASDYYSYSNSAAYTWRDGDSGATEEYRAIDTGKFALVSATDAAGNKTRYAYDSSGYLTSVKAATGETHTYTYVGYSYSARQLQSITATASDGTTLAKRVSYEYEGYSATSALKAVIVDLTPENSTDSVTYKTSYTYNASRQLESISQADGTRLTFAYYNGKVISVTDALNQRTSFSYGSGQTTVTDALGKATVYEYDSSGQLKKITAPPVNGVSQVTSYSYDTATGNLTQVVDPMGRALTMTYDSRGNQIQQRDSAGNTVRRTYDARNQVLTEAVYLVPDPDGSGYQEPSAPLVTRYVYDSSNKNLLRYVISAEGRVTEHRYDARGQRASTLQYTGSSYSVGALTVTSTPSLVQMDAWGASAVSQGVQRTDFKYETAPDLRSQLTTQTHWAKVGADGVGQSDGNETKTAYVYDYAGHLIKTIADDGRATAQITAYTYDGLGRVRFATDALNQVTINEYTASNANSTTIKLKAANGLVTTSVYDNAGRLTSVSQSSPSNAALGTTTYFYDALGRPVMSQDAVGVRAWMIYDSAGRNVADIDGDGSLTEYVYNADDQVTRSIAYATPVYTGALFNPVYGVPMPTLGSIRPLATASDRSSWRIYDSAGRLDKTIDGDGDMSEFFYDGASRLVKTQRYATAISTAALSNAPANFVAVTHADDRIERNFYDADGLLAATLDGEGYLTELSYSTSGQLFKRRQYAGVTSSELRASGTLDQLRTSAEAAANAVTPGLQSRVTWLLHDRKGQVSGEVDAEGYLTEKVYNSVGTVAKTIRYAERLSAPALAKLSATCMLDDSIRLSIAGAQQTEYEYDKLNRVSREIDFHGTVTEYTYDDAGNLTSTVRAVGSSDARALNSRYDLQGRLTGELTAQGAAQLSGGQTAAEIEAIWNQWGLTHTYDNAGQRTSTSDPYGNRTLFFYNIDGQLTHTVNALGEVSEIQYDTLGQQRATIRYGSRISLTGLTGASAGGLVNTALTTALNAARNTALDSVTSYTYTAGSRLKSSTDELGFTLNYVYNAFGEQNSRTQQLSAWQSVTDSFTYDRRGLLTETILDLGGFNAKSRQKYDAFGRVYETTDAGGNTRSQQYDRLGRVVVTTDALLKQRKTSYDAFDRIVSQEDELGKVTSYSYDAAQRSMTVRSPEGVTVITRFSRLGQTLSVSDGQNNTTRYAYDSNGNLKTVTAADGTAVQNNYDRANRLLDTRDANDNKVAFSYDAAHRLLSRIVDPSTADYIGLNLQTRYEYDAKGQQVLVTEPNGAATKLVYDLKGQLTERRVDPTGPKPLSTKYSYDGRSNVLTVTSPAGAVTQYTYDKLGRRIMEQVDLYGSNLKRNWNYNANGNLTSYTDANTNLTRQVYDAEGRLLFSVDPIGQVRRYGYDAAGRVVQTTRYANPISVAGLLPAITAAQVQPVADAQRDGVEHRVYDKDGRLTAVATALGDNKFSLVKYSYDALGRVNERIAYATAVTGWTAGAIPVPVASASDSRLRTVYDKLGRAIYTVDGMGAVVATTYDAQGNAIDQVAYAEPVDPAIEADEIALSAALAAKQDAARDSRLRQVYDAAGRLTWSADGAGSVTRRVYDPNGNVVKLVQYANAIASDASPDSVAQDQGYRTTHYAYDKAGRMVYSVDAMLGVVRYTHDADGNVTLRRAYAQPLTGSPAFTVEDLEREVVSDSSDREERFAYDGAGRQVFAVDALGAVRESVYDTAGHVIKTIAYDKTLNAAELASFTPTASVGDVRALSKKTSSDRTAFAAYDAAGRQVFAVEANGAVRETVYDAAGRATRTIAYARALTSASLASLSIAPSLSGIRSLVSVTDPENRTTGAVYDAADRRRYSIDAVGHLTETQYDGLGRATRTISYANAVPQGTAPTLTAITQAIQPDAARDRANRFDYDGAGRLVGSVDVLGGVESYTYDALGNKTSFTNKLLATWTYSHDAAGRLLSETTPTVSVTTINSAGTGSTSADSRMVTVIDYNAFGEVESRTEGSRAAPQDALQNSRRTEYRYDAAGRQTHTIFPTVQAYDAVAGERAVTPTVVVSYDAFGNAIANKDVGDRYSAKVYDRAGRVRWDIDAKGYVTGYARDTFGSVTQLTRYAVAMNGALSSAGTTESAMQAYLPTVDHAADRTLTTQYDALGRTVKVIEPLGEVFDQHALGAEYSVAARATETTYNALGDVLRTSVYGQNDQGARSTVSADSYFKYDILGRKTAQLAVFERMAQATTARAYLTTMAYDAAGNLTGQVEYADAVTLADSSWTDSAGTAYVLPAAKEQDRAVRYEWDLNNRKVSETRLGVSHGETPTGARLTGDETTRFGYDALGNATSTTNALGTTTYTYYDALGRVTAVATPSVQAMRTRISQLYVLMFNRAPEKDGLDFWIQRLQSGRSLNGVASEMFAAGQAAGQFAGGVVGTIYQRALGRSPEESALVFWTAELDAANARLESEPDALGHVFIAMIDSVQAYGGQEAAALKSQREFNIKVAAGVAYAVEQGGNDPVQAAKVTEDAVRLANAALQVAQLYVTILGRAPEAAALAGYQGEMTQAADPKSFAAIAQAIFDGDEARNLYLGAMDDAQVVARLYQNVYGKAPDEAELAALLVPKADQTAGQFVAGLIASVTAADASGAALAARPAFSNKVAAALPRQLDAVLALSPLTEFKLDIYGNVVKRIDHAGGAQSANAQGYTAGAARPFEDRISHTVYDSSGHAVRSIDALMYSSSTFYDVYGRVARQEQQVTADGVVQTAFKAMRYDALGQVIDVTDAVGSQQTVYNAFGEVTARGVDNQASYEYYDYDNAGHLWRTNAGDGVDKVALYDIAGRQTADIRSAVKNLKADYTSAAQVIPAADLVRTNTRYDLLGHSVGQTLPTQYANGLGSVNGSTVNSAPIVTLTAATLAAEVTAWAEPADPSGFDTPPQWIGTNTVALSWTSLAGLGSGDVRVELTYHGPDGTEPVVVTQDLRADLAMDKVTLSWQDQPPVVSIDRIQVSKKDIEGNWALLIDRDRGGDYGYQVRIHAPANPAARLWLRYGSAGAAELPLVPYAQLKRFGDAVLFDASAVPEGVYEYEVLKQEPDEANWSVWDQGTFSIVSPPSRRLVAELYVALLDRAPDAGGLAKYVAQYQSGTPLADIAQALYNQPDPGTTPLYAGLSDTDFVRKFYTLALGRADDGIEISDEEVAFWASQLAGNEANRGDLIVKMVAATTGYRYRGQEDTVGLNSQLRFNNKVEVGLKFAVELGGYDRAQARAVLEPVTENPDTAQIGPEIVQAMLARKQISELYVLLFNRAPDSGGLTHWLNRLTTGASIAEVAQEMFNSGVALGVYAATASNTEIVTRIYNTALGRAPDAAGLAFWTQRMAAAGVSRGQVFTEMVAAVNGYLGVDSAALTSQRLFKNKVAVAVAYQAQSHTITDPAVQLATATAVLAGITATSDPMETLGAVLAAALQAEQQAKVALDAALLQQAQAVAALAALAPGVPSQAAVNTEVAELYTLLFNRAPDLDGLKFWAARRAQGSSFEEVAQGMYASGQALNVFPQPDAGKEGLIITQIYVNALGRNPDAAGLAFWSQQLAAAATSADPNARGAVFVALITAVQTYSGPDAAAIKSKRLFDNKVAVGLAYASLGGNSAVTASNLLKLVTENDIGAAAAQLQLWMDAPKLAAEAAPAAAGTTAASNGASTALAATNAEAEARTFAGTAAVAAAASAATPTGDIRSEIVRLYVALYQRAPSLEELNSWVSARQATGSETVANQMIGQNWAAFGNLTATEFVNRIYANALGRWPDAAGLNYWVGLLNSGYSRGWVGAGILNSTAAYSGTDRLALGSQQFLDIAVANCLSPLVPAALTAQSTATTDLQSATATRNAATTAYNSPYKTNVCQLYAALLGRSPDVAGFNAWASQLSAGTPMVSVISLMLTTAPEAVSYYGGTNEDFVNKLYLRVCNRQADAGGLAYWVSRFPAASRAQVANEFINAVFYYTGTDPTGLASKTYFTGNVNSGLNAIAIAKTAADSAYAAATTALSAANSAYTDTTAAANAASTAATAATKWVVSCDAAAAASAAATTATGTATAEIRLALVRLFAAIYQRAPSLTELNTWTTARVQGQTAAQAATQMLATGEGQAYNRYPAALTNQEFVNQVFVVACGQPPDSAALVFWTTQLNGGVTRGQLVVNFNAAVVGWRGTDSTAISRQKFLMTNVANYLAALASNANSVYAAAQVTAAAAGAIGIGSSAVSGTASGCGQYVAETSYLTVGQLYTALLRREPTLAEARALAGQLQLGKSVAVAAQELLDSVAGRLVYPPGQSNSDFIKSFYLYALGRPADAEALAYWTAQLAGNSRGRVVELIFGNVTNYTGNSAAALASQALFNINSYAALITTWAVGNTAKAAADAEVARTTNAHKAPFDLWESLQGIADMNIAVGLQQGGQAVVAGMTQFGLTPNIDQTVDRWGNLLSVSDARNSGSITRYSYNANNQLLDTIRADGNNRTSNYYDQLGRQVAERDANGNVNRRRYDERGNLIEELHADGGIVQYQVDVFGQQTLVRQANGQLTAHSYDRRGHVVSTARAAGFGVDVYASQNLGTTLGTTFVNRTDLIESYAYDALGRRVATRNNAAVPEITNQTYDLRGNVIKSADPYGRVTKYSWDRFNHKNGEIQVVNDEDGAIQIDDRWMGWTLDAWGRVLGHVDLAGGGNGSHTYQYNQLKQLISHTSGHEQNLVYSYDHASGLLVKIEDKSKEASSGVQVTQYAYDAAGNRIREKTSLQKTNSDGSVTELDVAQDNHLTYDELGRLATVNDARYSVEYQYDGNGNRLHVLTHYLSETLADGTGGSTEHTVESWNHYDAMNRQTIVDGIKDAAGNIGIGTTAGQGQQIAYDNAGNRILARQWGKQLVADTAMDDVGPVTYWQVADGMTTESYAYDAAGRLTDTYRDGVSIDARRYDAAGRVVQSGTVLPDQLLLSKALRDAGVSTDLHISAYDQGRLSHQSVRGVNSSELEYVYDAVGRMAFYDLRIGDHLNTYTYRYENYDTSKVKSIEIKRDHSVTGATINEYDANGNLVHVEGGAYNEANTRDLINDAAGRVLRKTQGRTVTHILIANDEVVGSSSDEQAGIGTFRSSYVPINDASLTAGPTAYTVQTGETLQSIARAVWGNADLWYRIADANGINSVSPGQVITIPGKPNTIYNDVNTFKPYDASAMVGDTTPTLPAPKPKKRSFFGQLLAAIVTIIVAIYAPYLLELNGFVGGMAGGATGSIAGQVTGMALGVQDSFSWKQVALSVISGGISGGLSGVDFTGGAIDSLGNTVARAAVGNALTQGIGVATGLQKNFDWRGVAASAAGAGVGQAVGSALNSSGAFSGLGKFGGAVARGTVAGFAGGLATAALRGGRISVQQIATDSFGNALGYSLAVAMGPQPQSIYGLAGGDSEHGMRAASGTWEGSSADGAYDDTWRSQNLARMSGLAAETSAVGDVDWSASTSVMGAGASAPLPSMYPASQLVGSGRNAQGLGYHEWGNEGGAVAIATQVLPQNDLVPTELSPLSVADTGWTAADGRASAYRQWRDVQDAGVSQGSFLKYSIGGTMRRLSGVGYDVWDALIGAEENPSYLFSGAKKGAVNFGPELFNGAANALKTSLNGYSLIAERLGAGEGTFAGFRASDSHNVTPLYNYENKTEAGAAMLTNLAMAVGASKYGSYAIELDTGSAGTLSANSLGLKLVSPRYQPGVVTYGNELVPASGRWLDAGTPAPIPLQVARQLEGQSFKTFPELRDTIWQTIAKDSELNTGFGLRSLQQMESGYAPFAPRAFQNNAFGLRFNMHHVQPIGNGGAVYDLSNLRIVSPKMHYGFHYE